MKAILIAVLVVLVAVHSVDSGLSAPANDLQMAKRVPNAEEDYPPIAKRAGYRTNSGGGFRVGVKSMAKRGPSKIPIN